MSNDGLMSCTGALVADAMPHTDWLDLADAVTALRRQLEEARTRAVDSPIKLSVEEVTVEFGLELQRSAKGDGAFRFGVVSVGGGGERARRATHTVTLKLGARTDAGGSVDVSDEDDEL
ncbi:trypco2 family protein [Streptomyces sp. KR55]|uniref:trypco2 family protein n=1 Tax=Streptomyces sp. KR55 TaxID=3457425 RepID=UPI003FD00068